MVVFVLFDSLIFSLVSGVSASVVKNQFIHCDVEDQDDVHDLVVVPLLVEVNFVRLRDLIQHYTDVSCHDHDQHPEPKQEQLRSWCVDVPSDVYLVVQRHSQDECGYLSKV